jgi:pimeloyl-ACP methyl ester carboxylesterase
MIATFTLLALAQTPKITWADYSLSVGGTAIPCEMGRLKVPENRNNPKSREIELALVRLKAKTDNPGPALIYLDGGPGSSAIGLAQAPIYFQAFEKLREIGDVILLDQRGVGLSKPRLAYPSQFPIPQDFYESEEAFLNLWKARAKEALGFFMRDPGADPAGYNTEQSADDVNDIRKALGADKIRILGFSYGTHLGLSVIRRHGDHLAGAVLIGTEGPDDTLKPPLNGDKQIENIAKEVAKDPDLSKKIPDFKALVKACMDKLEKEPVTVTLKTGQGDKPFKVGKYGLQHLIFRDLGDTNDIPYFPLGFYGISQGNYQMLQALAQKRYSQYAPGTPLMTVLVDYSSGASLEREKLIEAQKGQAIFGNAMNFMDAPGAVLGIPTLPPSFRAPIKTNVPTLFLSGNLDWNTFPEQADAARKGFTKSTHIIVKRAGHESIWTNAPIQQAINDFFNGKDVSRVTLELDWKFMPIP